MRTKDRHPASYRDPAGFVFRKDGVIYRQVSTAGAADYDLFIQSGLYKTLTDKTWLISHVETEIENREADQHKILQPEQLEHISYPYEWCFSQLKRAALLTLNIQKSAIEHGLILKDASGYNIVFKHYQPLFIDTLSFEKYDPKKPWDAYRQFCEHFLAPLLLASYHGQGMIQVLRTFPEGIPLSLCSSLLPLRSGFNMLSALHIHFQSRVGSKKNQDKEIHFTKEKLLRLIDHLHGGIKRLRLKSEPSAWGDYYQQSILQDGYLPAKEKLVPLMLANIPFQSVLDVGSNTGQFALMLAEMGKTVVAIDSDPVCIERLYIHTRENKKQLSTFVTDILNPGPAQGWDLKERSSFHERFSADLILALALIHHLCISRNLSMEFLADGFSKLGKWLLIEFVPAEDEKAVLLMSGREGLFTAYNESNFREIFGQYFEILNESSVGNSKRTLFIMKSRSGR